MVIFIKKIITIIIIAVFLLFQTSCKSESAKDFNELIKTINSEYGYNFNEEDFTIEKRENIIYHTLIDNQTLLSLYSNKENEIIQCTLSSFNINNQEIFELAAQLGTIICLLRTGRNGHQLKNRRWVGRPKNPLISYLSM